MPTIASDNFDSYTNGANLNGLGSWSASSNWSIANIGFAQSSPNAAALANSTSGQATWQQNDGVSGNVQVSCSLLPSGVGSSFGNENQFRVMGRLTLPGASQSCYCAWFGDTGAANGGLQLYKQISGSLTNLGAVSVSEQNDWLNLLLKCDGTTISVQLKAITGTNAGKYLNSSGSWQSGQTYAISVTDSSIAGQGYAGFYARADYHNDSYWADDFLFESLAAAPVQLEGIMPGNADGVTRGFAF